MAIGVIIAIVAVLIIAIWVIIEIKRMKHKLFGIALIALVLFFYVSGTFVFKGKNINFASIDGVTEATSLYFSWLGSAFFNLKTITSDAIRMDWKGNSTSGD